MSYTPQGPWDPGDNFTHDEATAMDEGIADAHAQKVDRTGDTMSGSLLLEEGSASGLAIQRPGLGALRAGVLDSTGDAIIDLLSDVLGVGGVALRLYFRQDGVLRYGPSGSTGTHATVARVATGSYSGNGAFDRTIALPFRPIQWSIRNPSDGVHAQGAWDGQSAGGFGVYRAGSAGDQLAGSTQARRVGNSAAGGLVVGFTSEEDNRQTNRSGQTYFYTATG